MKARSTIFLLSTSLIAASVVASEEQKGPGLQQTVDYINGRLTRGDLKEHNSRLFLSRDHLTLCFKYASGEKDDQLQIEESIPVLSINVDAISAQPSVVLPCKNENCVVLVWKRFGTSRATVSEPSREFVIRSFLTNPYVRQNLVRAFKRLVEIVDTEKKSENEKDPFSH
jgi:hypothetical protein